MTKRAPPKQKTSAEYRRIWRVVDGAIKDAFHAHPDYLTEKGVRFQSARYSLCKRVTGALVGYTAQAVRGRSAKAAPDNGKPLSPAPVPDVPFVGRGEADQTSPHHHRDGAAT